MSKFVIKCSHCGNYAEARSGFLGIGKTRKINCSCGHVIDVQTEKLSSRQCHNCGNHVIFDQSEGDKAKCPVCGTAINTLAEQGKLVDFSCEQCGVRLQTRKSAATYQCPVCDHVNDIAERLKKEQIRNDGLASVIKYEGDNETLVWKHPIEDFNLGSQLIVHESQEAIFFRDGQALDRFKSGRYTLETQQLPILEQFYKLPTDTNGTFHSEVYYINMVTQMGIKWGTDSKVRLFDPTSGIHVELGACGEFSIRVTDSRKLLIKLVGTGKTLKQDDLLGNNGKGYFRAMIMTQVKSNLAAAIREKSIGILEIDERLLELSDVLREKINLRLAEYGLEMPDFFVSRVVLPENNKTFDYMRSQYGQTHILQQDDLIRRMKAQSDVNVKIIDAQGEAEILKIKEAAKSDAYRMKAQAEAEEMKMKGYTYQQETSRQVSLEAMKNGITGNGGIVGGLGDIASLGVTLGTMGSVMQMTQNAMTPAITSMTQMAEPVLAQMPSGWECSCGQKNITTNFCPDCGSKRLEKKTWNCTCGMSNIDSNFCPECGAKKPLGPWTCKCGKTEINTNFCPECGTKRGE